MALMMLTVKKYIQSMQKKNIPDVYRPTMIIMYYYSTLSTLKSKQITNI